MSPLLDGSVHYLHRGHIEDAAPHEAGGVGEEHVVEVSAGGRPVAHVEDLDLLALGALGRPDLPPRAPVAQL